jgi:hypothetical protein
VDAIFTDRFESGNLSAWSAQSVTGGGDVSVVTAAALGGTYGMRALINDNNAMYALDTTPVAEARYRARFMFDPNTITMASGNAHIVFQGYNSGGTALVYIEFRLSSGQYAVRGAIRNDATTFTATSWFAITDAPHAIEVDWRASTGAGLNNGGLSLWIDGTQRANLTGTDNDTRRVESARLGPISGIDTGTRGTYYFDEFVSRRVSYIGTGIVAAGDPLTTDGMQDMTFQPAFGVGPEIDESQVDVDETDQIQAPLGQNPLYLPFVNR